MQGHPPQVQHQQVRSLPVMTPRAARKLQTLLNKAKDASSKEEILLHTINIARDNNSEEFKSGPDLEKLTAWATENGKLQADAPAAGSSAAAGPGPVAAGSEATAAANEDGETQEDSAKENAADLDGELDIAPSADAAAAGNEANTAAPSKPCARLKRKAATAAIYQDNEDSENSDKENADGAYEQSPVAKDHEGSSIRRPMKLVFRLGKQQRVEQQQEDGDEQHVKRQLEQLQVENEQLQGENEQLRRENEQLRNRIEELEQQGEADNMP